MDGLRAKAFDVLRVAVALLLLVAAALKAQQLATEPVAGNSLLTYRWALIAQVEFEIVLGLWLLSGLWRRLAWAVTTACFVGFCGVTLYKGLTGEASCGCFGKVHVNPWYTLILDICVVSLFLALRPDLRSAHHVRLPRLRFALGAVLALTAGIPTGLAAAAYSPSKLTDNGQIVGNERFVVLEVETWAGKPLALLKYIDVGGQLTKGNWTLVLYHHDCPHCLKELPQFAEAAETEHKQDGAVRYAFVEMPPYGLLKDCQLPDLPVCLRGKLSDSRDWFAETPVVVGLVDGKAVSTKTGGAAAQAAKVKDGFWAFPADADKVEVGGDKGSYDFGFVQSGSEHFVEFLVTNASSVPLNVKKIANECQCMAVVSWPQVISPGGARAVQVRFEAPAETMRYSKRILLQTDDSAHPTITLLVEADVGVPLTGRLEDGKPITLGDGQERQLRLLVSNRSSRAVNPLYATSSDSGCLAMVPRAAIPPKGELAIPLVFRPGQAAGEHVAKISLHTDCPTQRVLEVQVKYTIAASEEKLARDDKGQGGLR